MHLPFLMSIFRLYSGSKLSFEHKSFRKNLLLSACRCWDDRLSLPQVDQKYNFGGVIASGDLCLDLLFRHLKEVRLHATLNNFAGVVRAHRGKDPFYCYMTRRGPISCVLGHVAGLLFCLYVKLFLPSNSNSLDFGSSLSYVVLHTELADINFFKRWGFF